MDGSTFYPTLTGQNLIVKENFMKYVDNEVSRHF